MLLKKTYLLPMSCYSFGLHKSWQQEFGIKKVPEPSYKGFK